MGRRPSHSLLATGPPTVLPVAGGRITYLRAQLTGGSRRRRRHREGERLGWLTGAGAGSGRQRPRGRAGAGIGLRASRRRRHGQPGPAGTGGSAARGHRWAASAGPSLATASAAGADRVATAPMAAAVGPRHRRGSNEPPERHWWRSAAMTARPTPWAGSLPRSVRASAKSRSVTRSASKAAHRKDRWRVERSPHGLTGYADRTVEARLLAKSPVSSTEVGASRGTEWRAGQHRNAALPCGQPVSTSQACTHRETRRVAPGEGWHRHGRAACQPHRS
jgi:hypothetical protein